MCHCTTSWLYVTFMLLSIALHSLTAVENSHFLQSPLYKRGCVVRTPAGGPHLLQQRLFFVYPRVGGGTHEEGRGGHQRANQMSAPFGGGIKAAFAPLRQHSVSSLVLVFFFFSLTAVFVTFPFCWDTSGVIQDLLQPVHLKASSVSVQTICFFSDGNWQTKKMRLIHNMTTIAEYPAPEYSVPNRVIKMAVIGGSGVGKTGKKTIKTSFLLWCYSDLFSILSCHMIF